MPRILACLVIGVCCAPLWAFDLPERALRAPALFEPAPILNAQDEAEEEVDEDNEEFGGRKIDGWNGRGVGISLSGTFVIGADIGLGVSMPVHEAASITASAHATAGFEFIGVYYDFGVRGYFDHGDEGNWSFYGEAGLRLSSGRVSDFARPDGNGNTLVNSGLGLGGYLDAGFEVGSPNVRFFLESSVGYSRMLEAPRVQLILVRVRAGLRIYIGAKG